MKQLVISCSLSPSSRSAILAQHLTRSLVDLGEETELIDLRDLTLPFCDADSSQSDANAAMLSAKIAGAQAISLAMPVYNYDVGGAARNLIALTGKAWSEKVVGLLAAAGGERSYMAPMAIANSLMLDFRCVIVPRYVYASRGSFDEGRLIDTTVQERVTSLASDLHRFAAALGVPAED